VSQKTLKRILVAWFLTPVVACFISLAITVASRLKYIPPLAF
jgi:phosphate/sulfate permease